MPLNSIREGVCAQAASQKTCHCMFYFVFQSRGRLGNVEITIHIHIAIVCGNM